MERRPFFGMKQNRENKVMKTNSENTKQWNEISVLCNVMREPSLVLVTVVKRVLPFTTFEDPDGIWNRAWLWERLHGPTQHENARDFGAKLGSKSVPNRSQIKNKNDPTPTLISRNFPIEFD